MADIDAPVVATDFIPLEKRGDVNTAITCWSYMFMTMLIALSTEGDQSGLEEQLIELAVPFEGLRICVCEDAPKGGGRKKTVGGVPPPELRLALVNALGPGRDEILARIEQSELRMAEARRRALERFERKVPLVQLLLRIAGAIVIALLPIGSKLIDAGIAIKTAQLAQSARLAAVTSTGAMVGRVAIDTAIKGLNEVDIAFADVGLAGVKGAAAASVAMKDIYGGLRDKIATFRSAPRLRETEKVQQAEMLVRWANTDQAIRAIRDYDLIFNKTEDISKQLKIESGTVPSGPARSDSTPEAVKKKLEDPVNYVMGIQNLAMSGEAWFYLGLNTFESHTMTFMKWSNTLAIILVGLISKDPGAVALCIMWVLSSFVGIMWLLDFILALTKKAEVDAAIALLNAGEEAHELRRAEGELHRHNGDFGRILAVYAGAPPAERGGRRPTRRNRHRRHRPSAPTRKGSSYSRRLRGSTGRRRG